MTPGAWSDAAVGDRAVTAVHGVEMEGERGHFEVLVMLVGRGKDTALVEIDHLFAAVPTVDVTDMAAHDRDQDPLRPAVTRRETIATAGLITLADLPPGWESAADAADEHRAEVQQSAQDDAVPDPWERQPAPLQGMPACETLLVEALRSARDRTRALRARRR